MRNKQCTFTAPVTMVSVSVLVSVHRLKYRYRGIGHVSLSFVL